jgi:hypothetical protein
VVDLIINKLLNKILSLILPFYIPQCLVIVAHMQTEISLVLLCEIDEGLRMNDVSEQVESLTNFFRIVYIR